MSDSKMFNGVNCNTSWEKQIALQV